MVILNYTHGTIGNVSACNSTNNSGLSQVSPEWTYCWNAYTYGFALLFATLVFYSVSITIKFRKRLLSKRIALHLVITIIGLGVFNILFLLIDYQGYYNRVPKIVIRLLAKLPYPLITGGYCLLQTIILKTTRLDIRPIRMNGRKFVTFISVTYIFVILALEITGTLLKNGSKLSLLADGLFVLLSIYLCISFIYGAPKLSRYANEVMKANKDLSVQSLSRKLEAMNDQPPCNTPSRLRNPRIRRSASSGNRISLISCSDTSDSESTMDKCSVYKKRSCRKIFKSGLFSNKRKHSNKQSLDKGLPNLLQYKKHTKHSSSDSEVEPKHASKSTNMTFMDRETGSDNECILSLDDTRTSCSNNNNTHMKKSQLLSENSDLDIPVEIILNPSLLSTNECNTFESGYVADSEQFSNHSEDRSGHRHSLQESRDRKTSSSSFDMSLPSSSSFLSLYRLRQGWMLRHVIRLVYFVTLLISVEVLFKVYAIFSSYGGLFFSSKPDPWPWLIFHTTQSANELAIFYIMMGVAHTVIAHKFHKKRKRKRRKSLVQIL